MNKKLKKIKAIIVDIDGTLSNNDHRKHFIEQNPKDWTSFNAEIEKDTINKWCADIILGMHKLYGYDLEILFVTGRKREYNEQTKEYDDRTYYWIDDNFEILLGNYKNSCFNVLWKIFYRNTNDKRDDFVIKEEIYNNFIKDKYDVLFCIEDRKQVVDMWRRNGLICLQCSEGNF